MQKQISVLNINWTDSLGARFNNFELSMGARETDIDHYFYVLDKQSTSSHVTSFQSNRWFGIWLQKITNYLGLRLSFPNILNIAPLIDLLTQKQFWRSDIVHIHIIHQNFMSIFCIPLLSRLKPTVITVHDMWLFTGHCIYVPVGCEKWSSGCGQCPNLQFPFPLERDTSKFLRLIKKNILRSKLTFIVASEIMKTVAEASLTHQRILKIPFGIESKEISRLDVLKTDFKKLHLIDSESFVISVRASPNLFKGLGVALEALKIVARNNARITLITVDQTDLCNELLKYPNIEVLDLGQVVEADRITEMMVASDIFLMPSIYEAFGVMALEAMACNTPVVYFRGTALGEICPNDFTGIECSADPKQLASSIIELMSDPMKLKRLKANCRRHITRNYTIELFEQRLNQVYRDVAEL